MDNSLKIFSFWAIDGFDFPAMQEQMKQLAALGFQGVIFHPRRYAGEPGYLSDAYMDQLSELILYAKETGLEFWLYDENGWPSGSANGQVEQELPDLTYQWLECDGGRVFKREAAGITPLSKRGTETFLRITHQAYAQKLWPEAFEYLGGFFSDEVDFFVRQDVIPWCEEISDRYEKEFGRSIEAKLSALFSEDPDDFKIWYWETLAQLLAKNFYIPIERWCREHSKLYTAHLKGEEEPFFQIGFSGSAFQVLRHISVPGIDALERNPGNWFYPRIASSLSRQFGSGIAMAEAMGGAGWGLRPSDVMRYTRWLIQSGINMLVFHINQLHLTYDGITDWPASIPCHQPWKAVFPSLIAQMREEAVRLEPARTLLICPTRGVMNTFAPKLTEGMNCHDGSHAMLCKSTKISREIVVMAEKLAHLGIAFDVTDEKIFEENGIVENARLGMGRCVYENVIAADGCIFTEHGKNMLTSLAAHWSPETFFGKNCTDHAAFTQTDWSYTPPEENRYFAEVSHGQAVIDTEYLCSCRLLVSDIGQGVLLNDAPLVPEARSDEGWFYKIPEDGLRLGCNTVTIKGVEKAFVYLLGKFAVKNRTPFFEFDRRQLYTANHFYITEPKVPDDDFILSGYPFAEQPVICKKRLNGDINGLLRIDCDYFAAARVLADGKELGWVYQDHEYVEINVDGECELVCQVYQSAFNLYGPHFHREGDRYLTSPMQYSGEKNFADTMSLPECTADDKMKFLKWSLKSDVEIIKKS